MIAYARVPVRVADAEHCAEDCPCLDEYSWMSAAGNEHTSNACALPMAAGDDAVDLNNDGRPIRCEACRKACEVQP